MTIQAQEGKPKLKYLGKNNKMPKDNFTMVPNEIIYGLGKYEALKPDDVRLYMILLGQVKFRNERQNQVDSDGDAYCYMRQDQLGEKAKIASRTTLRKYLKNLERLGLLYVAYGGTKKCNYYYVALPDKVDNDEKKFVDVNEIGKKLTDEEREKKKKKREREREIKAKNEKALKHSEVKRKFAERGILDIDLDATLEQTDDQRFTRVNGLSAEEQQKYNCKYVRDYYLKSVDDNSETCELFYRIIERKNAAGKVVVEIIDGIASTVKKSKATKQDVKKVLYKHEPENVYKIISHGMLSDSKSIDLNGAFESVGHNENDDDAPDI